MNRFEMIVAERAARGQLFNAYELTGGGYTIGIGPITDFIGFAQCHAPEAADMIVKGLRIALGQTPPICSLATEEASQQEDGR